MIARLNGRSVLTISLLGLLHSAALLYSTAQAQIEIEITSPSAAVMGGKQQIASVPNRTRFVVQQVQGDWHLVKVQTPDGPKQGWIHRKDVRQLFLPPKEPVQASVEFFKEQAEEPIRQRDHWWDAGKWNEAASAAEKIVLLYYRGFGSENKYTALEESLLAFCYSQAHRDYEAEKFYEHAIKVLEKDDFADTLTAAQNALANVYRRNGEYKKADLLSARSLELVESKHGPTKLTTAYALSVRGLVLIDLGRYREAESCLQRAQAIYEREHLPHLVESEFETLGMLYERMEQLDRALAAHERALDLKEARLGSEHVDLADTLSKLAKVQEKRGDYRAAEALFRRGLRLLAASPSPQTETRIRLLEGLGTTLGQAGKVGEADTLLLQVVELVRSAEGAESLGMARTLWVLGRHYYVLHQNEKAARELDRSMAIFEARVGRNHRDFLGAAQVAGVVYKDLGRLEEAEQLLREVVEGCQRCNESSWIPQVSLAGVYHQRGKLAEAETQFRQAIAQAEKEVGPEHPQLALSVTLLSEVYLTQGKLALAEPLLLRTIQIYEKRLGVNHSNLMVPLRYLARLQVRTGRFAEATSTFDRARRIVHAHLHNSLPWFSEREQLEALHREKAPLYMALSLALERPQDLSIVEHTAEWVLNGKAVAHEVLAQRALLSRSATTPELAEVVRELALVRQALASLVNAAPSQGSQPTKVLEQLTEREQALQKRLGQLGGQQETAARWIQLNEVRKYIPKDAVLVELAAIHHYDFLAPVLQPLSDPRYVAWVIPPAGEGEVRFVELGSENTITEAIQEFLKLSDTSAQQILQLGEKPAERRMADALDKVTQFMLRPLEKLIEPKRHWIISPDWYAWSVPWSALSLTKDRYVIEDHAISYRISGRQLVPNSPARNSPVNAVAAIFADPDFNLEPGEQESARPRREDLMAARSSEIAGRVPRNWSRLSGTAEETAATLPKLTAWLGNKPTVYLQREAREAQFRQLKSPRALVISTHGYFLEDKNREPTEKPLDKQQTETIEPQHVNDLLRCGLVLAGANRRPATPDGQDDGILTGLEILATDLRGTEIVVLSACQTAGGVFSAGEGVAGLQQVFQLAGGRSVVATLWNIPDAETADLMTYFWHFMAQKQAKGDALRNAQLAVIKDRRAQGGASHPYYWAAFTISGDAN